MSELLQMIMYDSPQERGSGLLAKLGENKELSSLDVILIKRRSFLGEKNDSGKKKTYKMQTKPC